MEIAKGRTGVQVVGDDYFVASQSVAVAKGDPARAEAVAKMVDEILATDVVSSAIHRAGLMGVGAAKPRGK
jgi:hypothetical protein